MKFAVANSSQSEAAKPSGEHLGEVVANCDNHVNGELTLSKHDIESFIRTIRGQKVMVDSKLRTLPYAFTRNGIGMPHKNHDRFLIIDDKVYFMGASLKDMGAGLCAVKEMQVSPETILELLK